MRNGIIGLCALLSSALGSSCVSATEDDVGRDFEFFIEDGSLEELELTFDEQSGDVVATVAVDRERNGARFAWGGEISRGYFQVVREDLTYSYEGLRNEFEMAGIGGGAMGSPTIGDTNGDLVMMVPWRVDGTLLAGEDDNLEPNLLAYVEVHADIGFGFQWKGLHPSIGLAYSSITGKLLPDDDDMEDEEDVEIEGANSGFFVDLRYLPEGYPIYGHLRLLAGDYEVTTFGVGIRF